MYDYYKKINLPTYAPPGFVFYYVWMCLYFLMFVSFVVLLFMQNSFIRLLALMVFSIQIFINLSWPLIFFKWKNIGLSCIVSFVLLLLVIFMTILFFKLSVFLGLLQVPYLIWLIFANILNLDVYMLNRCR